jgi:hypothetical protein
MVFVFKEDGAFATHYLLLKYGAYGKFHQLLTLV